MTDRREFRMPFPSAIQWAQEAIDGLVGQTMPITGSTGNDQATVIAARVVNDEFGSAIMLTLDLEIPDEPDGDVLLRRLGLVLGEGGDERCSTCRLTADNPDGVYCSNPWHLRHPPPDPDETSG